MKSIFLVLIVISSIQAGPYWRKLHKDYKLNYKKHSFCYMDNSGEIKGENINKKVRLASVSKLVTTMWAINKLKADFKYNTKFYYHDKKLHIEGTKDPLFASRKLFFILSQLNNLGITQLDEITFDKNFFAYSKGEGYVSTTFKVSKDKVSKNLEAYFHTPDWNLLKKSYIRFIKRTPQPVLSDLQIIKDFDNIKMTVKSVKYSKENPLKDVGEALQTYEHISSSLSRYLKFMNVNSNNFVADQTFFQLGGKKKFKKYIKKFMKKEFPGYKNIRKGFKKGEKSIRIQTGSGLNSIVDSERFDNYATCAIIVKLVKNLKDSMEEQNQEIQDIVAVPGSDKGTFSKRLRSRRISKSTTMKTGTLRNTSALAGTLSTETGEYYFGVFHQLKGYKGNAKTIQNKLVYRLMKELGGKKKFKYKSKYFFPATEPMR